MDYKITISPTAKKSFYDNIAHLEREWTINEIDAFIVKTETVLKIIKTQPYAFKKVDFLNKMRVAIVVKQISMFYAIENDEILIMLFWNNYQDPEKLKDLL